VYTDGGSLWSRTIEPDLDGDGLVEACDCNDLDVSQSAPAAIVDSLGGERVATDAHLSWQMPPAAGPGDAFTVLRAASAEAYAGGGGIQCLAVQSEDTDVVDAATPTVGSAFYYVVRVDNGCGTGPLAAGRPAGEAEDCQP